MALSTLLNSGNFLSRVSMSILWWLLLLVHAELELIVLKIFNELLHVRHFKVVIVK